MTIGWDPRIQHFLSTTSSEGLSPTVFEFGNRQYGITGKLSKVDNGPVTIWTHVLSDSLLKYLQSGVIDITTLCNINPMLSNCILKSVGRNVFDNMSPVLGGYTLNYLGSVVLYFQTATDRTNK